MKCSAYIASVNIHMEYNSSINNNVLALIHKPLKKLNIPVDKTLIEQADILLQNISELHKIDSNNSVSDLPLAASLKTEVVRGSSLESVIASNWALNYSIILADTSNPKPIITNEHTDDTKRSWCYYYNTLDNCWCKNPLITTGYIHNKLHYIGG